MGAVREAEATLGSPRRVAWIAVVAVAVFVLDRLAKDAIVASLAPGESRAIIGETVRLTHVQNTGAAFGLLPERSTVLSVLSVFAVAVILLYYRRLRTDSPLVATTLGLQLGGAFGNLLDRVRQGYVVDFIDVGVDRFRWWAFNVADASIVVGILSVIGLLWLEERRSR